MITTACKRTSVRYVYAGDIALAIALASFFVYKRVSCNRN